MADTELVSVLASVWGFDYRRTMVFMGRMRITDRQNAYGELIRRGLDSFETETQSKLIPEGEQINESR